MASKSVIIQSREPEHIRFEAIGSPAPSYLSYNAGLSDHGTPALSATVRSTPAVDTLPARRILGHRQRGVFTTSTSLPSTRSLISSTSAQPQIRDLGPYIATIAHDLDNAAFSIRIFIARSGHSWSPIDTVETTLFASAFSIREAYFKAYQECVDKSIPIEGSELQVTSAIAEYVTEIAKQCNVGILLLNDGAIIELILTIADIIRVAVIRLVAMIYLRALLKNPLPDLPSSRSIGVDKIIQQAQQYCSLALLVQTNVPNLNLQITSCCCCEWVNGLLDESDGHWSDVSNRIIRFEYHKVYLIDRYLLKSHLERNPQSQDQSKYGCVLCDVKNIVTHSKNVKELAEHLRTQHTIGECDYEPDIKVVELDLDLGRPDLNLFDFEAHLGFSPPVSPNL